MSNFKIVNSAVKKEFKNLDISVMRGKGYIYFIGIDGEEIESIMTHPTSTQTVIEIVLETIQKHIDAHNV